LLAFKVIGSLSPVVLETPAIQSVKYEDTAASQRLPYPAEESPELHGRLKVADYIPGCKCSFARLGFAKRPQIRVNKPDALSKPPAARARHFEHVRGAIDSNDHAAMLSKPFR
jgi:hypothetical protein